MAFVPTHAAPSDGLRTWTSPGGDPAPDIPAGMEVQLAERQGDWARVVCSNEWSTWVDARQLIDLTALQSTASELVSRLSAAVNEYEHAVSEAEAGRIDGAEFQRRAFKAGMLVSEHEVWFLDLPNARWCRYDGLGVTMLDVKGG